MKKKYVILLFISFLLLTSGITYSKDLSPSLMNKVIVLDAGHGGKDKGTSVQGIYESDINLEIVLKLQKELIKQGATVLLTRDGDYDLSSPDASRRKKSDFDNRIQFINTSNATLYLSIHINYLSDSKYYGAQVFYLDGNERLATQIQEGFIQNLGSPMETKKISSEIYMYKQLKVPGVLIECGFLSNAKERNLLTSEVYQEKIVSSIVQSLNSYYSFV